MDFPCNQLIAGVHEGQAYAWQTLVGPGTITFTTCSGGQMIAYAATGMSFKS
jgi:hypothetical protein